MAEHILTINFTTRVGCKYLIPFKDELSMDEAVQILSEMSGEKKESIRLCSGLMLDRDMIFKESTECFIALSDDWSDKDAIDVGELAEAMRELNEDDEEDEMGCAQM